MTVLDYGQIHSGIIRSEFCRDAKNDSDAEIERIFSRERGWPPFVADAAKALRDSGANLLIPPAPEPYDEGLLNEYFVEQDRLACISATGYEPDEISRMSQKELAENLG